MSLAPGSHLLHYEIVGRLGAGAMGEVWRAKDTRLGREVAVKVLPPHFAQEEERLRRFEREARALAALNHPNVAQIFGVDQADDVYFLVLELVPGESLDERLKRGPLPLMEALDVARQIAEGLEAAHEAGVIHRDLKPANVRVTPDGKVKVLDFGLAKPAREAGSSQSSTDSVLSTEAGRLLGTPTYMAPEQARGKAIDKRVDIWAFGCVLYECLTAKRAFVGETLTDVLGAVLHSNADLDALPANTPRRVRALIENCFVKDPRRRLRDIGQARVELERSAMDGDDVGEAAARGVRRVATRLPSVWWLAPAAVALIALGAGLWSAFAPQARVTSEPTCVSVALPPEIVFLGTQIAPDGRTLIAYGRPRTPSGTDEAPLRVYVRRMDGFEFEALAGTERVETGAPTHDGRGLLFVGTVDAGATHKQLAYVPLDGSAPPTTIAAWQSGWVTFTELANGEILIADTALTFVRLQRSGGPPSPPVRMDAGRSEVQRFELQSPPLPNGRSLLVNVVSYGDRGFQYSVGVLDLATGRVDVVVEDGGNPRYSSTGHLLFARGDVLLAAPFDLERSRVLGPPVAVWSGAQSVNRAFPAYFQLTDAGALAYQPGGSNFAHALAVLTDDGALEPWSSERLTLSGPLSVSPDGRHVLLQSLNARGIDEFAISSVDQPDFIRLGTEMNVDSFYGVWSPDGGRVAYFRVGRDGRDGVYIRDVDSGEQRCVLTVTEDEGVFVTAWLGDASALFVTRFRDGRSSIELLPIADGVTDTARMQPLLTSEFNRSFARPSRDGRLVAFMSDESGARHTWVAPMRADGRIGRALRVKTEGSKWFAWAADGGALFVQDERNRLQEVQVNSEPELSLSEPVEVANFDELRVQMWEVLAQGKFLVGVKEDGAGEVRRVDLVFDWTAHLESQMEAGR